MDGCVSRWGRVVHWGSCLEHLKVVDRGVAERGKWVVDGFGLEQFLAKTLRMLQNLHRNSAFQKRSQTLSKNSKKMKIISKILR